MGEALLELLAHPVAVAHHVPGPHQEVHEVEASGLGLELLVIFHHGPEVVAQLGGEARARPVEKDLEPLVERVAALPELLLGEIGRGSREPLPPPVPEPAEPDEPRFQPIGVGAVHRREALGLRHESGDLDERLREVVLGIAALGPGCQIGHLGHQILELGLAVEALQASPRSREVAAIHQRAGRVSEQRPGALLARPAAEDPLHPGPGLGELALEPAVEGAVEELVGNVFRRHLELRIDPGLDRPLAQEIGAEGVDGPDPGLLEPGECIGQALALGLRHGFVPAGALDLGSQPELHLARGDLGEGHRHHPVEPPLAGSQHGQDAPDELRGLSGPGRRLDDQRGVEVGGDPLACLVIGDRRRSLGGKGAGLLEPAHSIPRRRLRPARPFAGLRLVRNSSHGPQTGR